MLAAPAHSAAAGRPSDIVDAATVIPALQLDMRYLTAHNFVGRPIAGYRAPKCLLTKRAAEALKGVEDELRPRRLGLKVYDCYRPQTAVDDFVKWGRNLADQKMKAEFYPGVDKARLFRDGYIASRSGHSRASTVDLTIAPLDAGAPPARAAGAPPASCEAPKEVRAPDTSLDMGTAFDCFSRRSHTQLRRHRQGAAGKPRAFALAHARARVCRAAVGVVALHAALRALPAHLLRLPRGIVC